MRVRVRVRVRVHVDVPIRVHVRMRVRVSARSHERACVCSYTRASARAPCGSWNMFTCVTTYPSVTCFPLYSNKSSRVA